MTSSINVPRLRRRRAFFPSAARDDPPEAALLLDLLTRHRDRLRPLERDTVEMRSWQFLVPRTLPLWRTLSACRVETHLDAQGGSIESRSAGLGRCLAETCGRLVYVFPGQLSSRPSPVGTNTLVCPSRRQAARRMFEPRSRGLCGPLLGQSFDSWYCAPHAAGSFRRSTASSGRAGPGAGPAGCANGSTSFSFVPGISCKLSCSFKEA